MGQPATTCHRELVAASWRRCQETYGLEARAAKPILRLQAAETARRLDRLKDTSHRIFREVGRAAAVVRRTGGLLVVTDVDRIVVDLVQNPAYTAHDVGERIALGSCWNERVAGTNGVHMGLVSGRPFTVRGADHYYKALNRFACTSVPLLDAQDTPIASLTHSIIDRHREGDHLFAQKLVGRTARRVHRALFLDAFEDCRIVRVEADGGDRADGPTDALLAVRGDGAIGGASMPAARAFGLSDVSQLMGIEIEALLDLSLHKIETGLTKTPVEARGARTLLVETLERERPERARPGAVPVTALARRRYPALEKLAVGNPGLSRQLRRAVRMLAEGMPLNVAGPTGAGKSTVVEALVAETDPRQTVLVVNAAASSAGDQRIDLDFVETVYATSCLEDLPLGFLSVENAEELTWDAQACLVQLMERLERDAAEPGRRPARNLRVVASSRTPLDELGPDLFRSDLASHLTATSVRLEPLAERPDRHQILGGVAAELAGRAVSISAEAWTLLDAYGWPGNVREAWSVLREALLCGDGATITPVDLPDRLQAASLPRSAAAADAPYSEERRVRDALASAGWNVSLAARNLGMGRATLNRRIHQFGLARPR